jgi:hypothetical protein
VKATYNLLVDGIVKLLTAQTGGESPRVSICASQDDFSPNLSSSINGTIEINQDNPCDLKAFLIGIVADADPLLSQTSFPE